MSHKNRAPRRWTCSTWPAPRSIEAEGDGPGQGRNEGSTEAIVYVTNIAPADTTVFRIDQANSNTKRNQART